MEQCSFTSAISVNNAQNTSYMESLQCLSGWGDVNMWWVLDLQQIGNLSEGGSVPLVNTYVAQEQFNVSRLVHQRISQVLWSSSDLKYSWVVQTATTCTRARKVEALRTCCPQMLLLSTSEACPEQLSKGTQLQRVQFRKQQPNCSIGAALYICI